MKTALFVHTHPFYSVNDKYYSPGRFPAANWSRYFDTELIDKLIVVGRGKKVNKVLPGLVQSSTENTAFDLLYEVQGGKDYYTKSSLIHKHLEKHIRNVDYVIIRNSSFGKTAAKICRKIGKPYITEVVSCSWDALWNYGNLAGKILAPQSFFGIQKLVKHSFATLYVTEYFLQRRYPTNAKITTHASNVEIPETDKEIKTKHIGVLKKKNDEKTYKIGQVGNIGIKYKGFDVALKAFYHLKKQNPDFNFKFYMVGGGDSSYIKNIIEKYNLQKETEIVGRLESGEEGIFKFLYTLDLYIQPSKTEGLPRATIEAMSRACPVLASNAGGIPELIPDKYLHSPGDDKTLSKDLAQILPDLNQRVKMAKENFEKSKEYTQAILSNRRRQFYQKAFEEIDKI